MNTKTIIGIMIVLIVLTLSGCNKSGIDGDPLSINPKDIFSGSDGLVISFIENTPPTEVLEESRFPVGIKIENTGAFPQEGENFEGFLAIGLESTYMNMEDGTFESTSPDSMIKLLGDDKKHVKLNDLSAKTIEYPQGSQNIITFAVKTEKLEKKSQTHKSAITITSCYNYNTKMTESVCVDTDVYNLKQRTKSCTTKDLTFDDQGAPVAITKIETKMLPLSTNKVEPLFIIHVENKGKGLVVKDDSVKDACYANVLEYPNVNMIKLSAFLVGAGKENQLDCDSEKTGINPAEKRLDENKATIRCSYADGISTSDGVYLTPLRIQIDYGYTSSISKEVEIKKLST